VSNTRKPAYVLSGEALQSSVLLSRAFKVDARKEMGKEKREGGHRKENNCLDMVFIGGSIRQGLQAQFLACF
jgi:hypothetical protein